MYFLVRYGFFFFIIIITYTHTLLRYMAGTFKYYIGLGHLLEEKKTKVAQTNDFKLSTHISI